MKIGFDGKRVTHNFRGLGNYSRGLIEGLLSYTNDDLFLYTSAYRHPRAKKWVQDHESARLKLRMPQGLISSKIPSLWRSYGVVEEIIKDDLDIYHGLSHEIPYGLNKTKTKSVVTIHDLIFMRYPEFFPLIDRLNYKRKFSYAVKNADLVLAICDQTKKDIIEFLGGDEKKIQVHYQSCDPHFYEARPFHTKKELMLKYGYERPFILCVGAIEERKNQLGLIEAYAQIADKIEQDLVIIGQGKKYYEACLKKVEDLKLSRRVHFLSNISFDELPVFYQTADLFCFPSFFEGFGIPIVEALYSKTPVLTSYGSCFPESAGEFSAYADPHSIKDIASQMLKILESPELQESMVNKSFDFVQKFSRENSTAELLKCYKSLF